MLFNIFVVSIIVAVGLSIALAYTLSPSYDAAGNAGMAVFIVIVVGGILLFLTMLGASSAGKENTKSHVVKTEKTYTVTENSVPTLDKGELKFSYTENGQVFAFSDHVDAFNVGLEKPKAFKITEYDVLDKGIAEWPINDGTKVEVIK